MRSILKLVHSFQSSSIPEHPSYLHQLASILEEARSPKPIPFFRRRDIEAPFGLRKRQAVRLLHRIGAIRVSRELAVEQRDLVRWLERQIADPVTIAEEERHTRVIDRIVELKDEMAARRVKIVLPAGASLTEIPAGVLLQPGVLTVTFQSQEELLERLFLLARAFATQPDLLSQVPLVC